MFHHLFYPEKFGFKWEFTSMWGHYSNIWPCLTKKTSGGGWRDGHCEEVNVGIYPPECVYHIDDWSSLLRLLASTCSAWGPLWVGTVVETKNIQKQSVFHLLVAPSSGPRSFQFPGMCWRSSGPVRKRCLGQAEWSVGSKGGQSGLWCLQGKHTQDCWIPPVPDCYHGHPERCPRKWCKTIPGHCQETWQIGSAPGIGIQMVGYRVQGSNYSRNWIPQWTLQQWWWLLACWRRKAPFVVILFWDILSCFGFIHNSVDRWTNKQGRWLRK